MEKTRSAPPGLVLARRVGGAAACGRNAHRGLVLALTFVAYACYHASRKPTSIVKSGWAPSTAPRHRQARRDRRRFLACYSLGMYGAGHLGDRLDLRLFLSAGMIGSGAFVALFGIGYFWRVHCFAYYLAMQMLAGLLQATGWPSWSPSWGIGFSLPRREEEEEGGRDDEEGPGGDRGKGERGGAVGIVKAFLIPGVIPFALCLFFSKLVAYTFLYWLPFYLSQTAIGGEYMSVKSAGNLSTLFDVGGIIGGILAGYISDQLNARATTAATFMYFAIPALYAYHAYGSISQSTNIILMMIAGLFVNGPYALITTAVSADLGTHKSLRGDSRALATVTAIIDGTGSVGAALGPLLTGFMSRSGWCAVFKMLMVGAFIAGMLLSVLVKAELAQIFHHRINPSNDRLNGAEGKSICSVVTPLLVEGNQPQYLCSNRYSQAMLVEILADF
ncbi:putative glycerol-3-phosphate transporter 3 [Ananas comosus]|uniref:Putative glycerol-3-phosphate transporter 3 n=1 Tax=Ananas comosus TaxID=4615 RepID=A0A199UKA9_ANACO|nr:putative glycerol-3-phosphate transporter 3 [Ananas comosus]